VPSSWCTRDACVSYCCLGIEFWLDEHRETLQIEARVVEQSLITRQLSFELGQLWPGVAAVDLGEQVSSLTIWPS